jgi:hypothetical protein
MRVPDHDTLGAGSVLQHVVAEGGRMNPPLFRAAITSSTFLPSQYKYNARSPEVNEDFVIPSFGMHIDLNNVGIQLLYNTTLAKTK